MGFTGTRWHVLNWMRPRRRAPSKHTPGRQRSKNENDTVEAEAVSKLALPSVPQLAWLVLQDTASLKNEQAVVVRHLLQDARFAFVRNHAITFRKMVCLRNAAGFDDWLTISEQSSVAQLRTFSLGLRRNYAEVKAALELPWSNGQTEGQVNKLKTIKRQMYGRANFDLLRQRVLLAA